MTEIRALVLRGSILRVTLLVINVGVAFYMMPFVIHSIGERFYGMWALIGTFMGYYGYMDFGLSLATQRFMAGAIGRNDTHELNQLFNTSLTVLAVLAGVAIAITVVIAAAAPWMFVDAAEAQTFRTAILVLALNIAVTLMMAPINGLITGTLRYDVATYVELGKLVFRTGLIFYFIGAGYSILALAVITLLSDVGANTIRMALALRMFPSVRLGRRYLSRSHRASLFSYGWGTFVNQCADLMRFQLDHVVIAAFINLSAVTLFNIAGQLVFYFREVLIALTGVLVPLYARYQAADDRETMFKAYYFVSKLAIVASILIGGAAIIFGRQFIVLWMGEAFVQAYTLVLLLIIPVIMFVSQTPSNALVFGLGKPGVLAKVAMADAVCNLLLSVALVKPFGLAGVALGTGIPMIGFSLFLLVYTNRLVGGSVWVYLQNVLPVFAICTGLQVATWFIAGELDFSSYAKLAFWLAVLYPPQIVLLLAFGFARSERALIARTCLQAAGLR